MTAFGLFISFEVHDNGREQESTILNLPNASLQIVEAEVADLVFDAAQIHDGATLKPIGTA